MTEENIPAGDVLQLFLNTLYVISETDKDLDLIYCIFRIRLLAILGFLPQVAKCVNCETPMLEEMEKFYFSVKDDGVKCEPCSRLDKSVIELSKTTFSALIYILSCDSKKLFSFEIPERDLQELKLLCKIYTNQKLDKEYDIQKFNI